MELVDLVLMNEEVDENGEMTANPMMVLRKNHFSKTEPLEISVDEQYSEFFLNYDDAESIVEYINKHILPPEEEVEKPNHLHEKDIELLDRVIQVLIINSSCSHLDEIKKLKVIRASL